MNSRQQLLYKCFFVILSNVILGSGTGLLRIIHFGIDPFSGMTLGISYFAREILNIPFMTCGFFQMCLSIVLIVFVLLSDKSYIGFGTIINMVFLGYIADGAEILFLHIFGSDIVLILRLLLMLIGITMIALGVGVYSAFNMGMGPYDAIPYIIQKNGNGKIHYRYIRMMTDCFCLLVAIASAAPVHRISTVAGLATIILALCLGPLNYFFRVYLGEKILLKPISQKSN